MALAHDFVVNGIYYMKHSDGKTVCVSCKSDGYHNYYGVYSGSVNIPPSVIYSWNAYDVTSINGEAFMNCS